MSAAPLELVMLEFPGNRFRGEIVPALEQLVRQGIIDIVDGLLVTKGSDDTVRIIEVAHLDDDDGGLGALIGEPSSVVAEEDVLELAGSLAPNSSAAILLFEHVWAGALAQAVRAADGQVRLSLRIPAAVVDEVLKARAEVG
jgi:hypothetical protein